MLWGHQWKSFVENTSLPVRVMSSILFWSQQGQLASGTDEIEKYFMYMS